MYTDGLRIPCRGVAQGTKRSGHGFTLIELLVVIAILAVLAALLFPSLKQARRQALLVHCLSNLRQNGIAVLAYTTDHDGYFPRRWDFTGQIGTAAPSTLAQLGPIQDNDLRDELGSYTATELTFLCPFVKRVDLSLVAPRLEVEGSYNMWFGWPPEIRNNAGSESSPGVEGRIRRDDNPEFTYDGKRFNVLLSDLELHYTALGRTSSSHPAPGVATPSSADGEFMGDNQRVFSYYVGLDTPETTFDLNFVFADGHGELLSRIKRQNDPRVHPVPSHWGIFQSLLPIAR